MAHALPVRLNSFRHRHMTYYVGVECLMEEHADKYYVVKALMQKVMQISSYCRQHGRKVTAILNSKDTPDYVAGILSTLGVECISIVKDAMDPVVGNFLVKENPRKFIAENAEVVIVIKSGESEYDTDSDTPIVYITYPLAVPRAKRTDSPGDVIRTQNEKFRSNNNPYGVFDLGEQGERVFDDYMTRIMVAPEPTGVPKPLQRTS